jgi:hypothetical protein
MCFVPGSTRWVNPKAAVILAAYVSGTKKGPMSLSSSYWYLGSPDFDTTPRGIPKIDNP